MALDPGWTPEREQSVLHLIYALLVRRGGTWPSFAQVRGHLERGLRVSDPGAVLAGLGADLLGTPRSGAGTGFEAGAGSGAGTGPGVGYADEDPVRLSLRGVDRCEGGRADLELLVGFLHWAGGRCAAALAAPSGTAPDRLVLAGVDFARMRSAEQACSQGQASPAGQAHGEGEEDVEPELRGALVRLRALAGLLDGPWVAEQQDPGRPWRWQLVVDPRRVGDRAELAVADVPQLLDLVEPIRVPPKDPQTPEPGRSVPAAGPVPVGVVAPVPAGAAAPGVAADPDPDPAADIAAGAAAKGEQDPGWTLLRPELADRCGALVHAGRHDEAVGEACRFLESVVRTRTGRAGSGDLLFRAAFGNGPMSEGDSGHGNGRAGAVSTASGGSDRPLDVAGCPQAAHRTQALCAGAVALFDPERWAEGSAPVPCRDRTDCLRRLVLVSSLLDLLDRDRHRAPAVVGHDPEGDVLRLRVLRAGVDPQVLVDGQEVGVLSRSGEAAGAEEILCVDIASLSPGDHEVLVLDGPRQGEPVTVRVEASAGPDRTSRVHLAPECLLLREGDRVPLQALARRLDGGGARTEPILDPDVRSADPSVAVVAEGTVAATGSGRTTLVLRHGGLFAEAVVEVAAHPRGTVTDWLTGLPPVTGLVNTPGGLVLCTGQPLVTRVDGQGRVGVLARLPRALWEGDAGAQRLAASPTGDLAVRRERQPGILVLHAGGRYRSSHWVPISGALAEPCALAWSGSTLVSVLPSGAVWCLREDGRPGQVGRVSGVPLDVTADAQDIWVLTGAPVPGLWRLPVLGGRDPVNLRPARDGDGAGTLVHHAGAHLLGDAAGGRVLRRDDAGQETVVASGLQGPGCLAVAGDGAVHVAEPGRGAVLRILP